MNLKTTRKIATENFAPDPSDKNTLELLGNDVLSETRRNLHTFKELFGFKNLFYYHAQQTCSEAAKDGELGIGYLKKKKSKTLLIRTKMLTPTFEGKPYNGNKNNFCTFPVVHPDDCLIVTSFIPSELTSFFPSKNSVLASSEEFAPSSIHLDNNSLLVCFDNQLQSMTFKEFARRLHEYT
tara:strand:+ start:200 stop:742 length:543 start_codon:yes stop_codon:yes gene_type:complete